jgi:outer membrane protein assembly factor BamB
MDYLNGGVAAAVACGLFASTANAQVQDWSNLGGNARANGLVNVVGPDGVGPDDLLWEGGAFSYISWNPVIEGRRVFVVRQNAFCPNPPPGDATIHALDLDTGATLWTADIPYEAGDWTTWIAGVKNGRIYASRSGNGGSVSAPLYCLNAATGAVLWHTAGGSIAPRHEISGGPYAGAVFASDGDLIITSMNSIQRIDSVTGQVLWNTARSEQVGNTSGPVLEGNAVYLADSFGNRIAIRKIDATTGAALYRGPLLSGVLLHNTPYIGIDGRIYLPYTQNFNVNVDFLYSFTDTGQSIIENWRISSGGGGEFSRWGVGPDGSLYSMSWSGTQDDNASGILQRLNPATGAVIDTFEEPITGDYMQIHMAVDSRGVLYVSNGTAGGLGGGRLYSFNPDLTLRWQTPLPGNINQGAPILGTDGTLIVASTGDVLRAYRSTPRCRSDFNDDGGVDGDDIIAYFAAWDAAQLSADMDGNQGVDGDDVIIFFALWDSGC